MTLLVEHIVALPLMIPLIGGVLLLKGDRAYKAWGALVVMSAALACSGFLFGTVLQNGQPMALQIGGWAAPFGITLIADMLSVLFVLMSQLVLVMGVLYAMGSKDRCTDYPAFYSLFLFLATGLTGAMLTGDIFNLFVFVELVAISSTVLTSISDDRYGTEAAYKYFYMSQLAAFFLLLAVGALYVSCGTLNMAHLAILIADEPKKLLLTPAAALLMATFMIKSATFPFHFWQPDFHTAAPTPVSAMLSSVVVKFGVYGFIRMTTLLFTGYATPIQPLLIGLGIAGIFYGGLSAVGTQNVKRMLAYSTLAQVGFILVAIGWGTPLALAGILFFIGGLGLAGIPPTNGFISKMLVFKSGIDARQLWTLLLVGLASTLTLFYTMRAFMRIWWHTPGEGIVTKATGDALFAPAVLVALVLLLGIAAEPLIALSQEAVRWLNTPEIYIRAVLGG